MIRVLLIATLLVPSLQQKVPQSPCPNVFSYEPPVSEPDRWYGVIDLSTDVTLHSVWINVVLDSKADILGNWIGDVTTADNTIFNIANSQLKLQPGPSTAVRFFVKYNLLNKTPKLQAIRLNGREICNANNMPDIDITRTTSMPTEDLRPEDLPQTKPIRGQQSTNGPVYSSTQGYVQLNPVNLNIDGGQIPAQSVGTQTGTGIKTGTQTGPNFPSRPDNGFRLTTAAPIRTTTYDDEDYSNVKPDYFGGGQPSLIVPSNPTNNNNNNHNNNNNNEQVECGKVVRNNPNPLVVNGHPTLEGQWPWQIALYHAQKVDNKYICGGTLVTRSHVITAAHCVTRKGSKRIVNPNTLTVFLGKHNLRTSVEGVQVKFLSEIRVHPSYNASSYSRDVSVLKLREPVQYTDFVRPACLWPNNQVDLANIIGKKGSVVGWGFDDKGLATEELTLVEMPVVDQNTCMASYSNFFTRYTSEYTYCAGYRDDGSTVCNGDSGGGMVFLMRNAWYLRGLVSLSVAPQNDRCDPNRYVVFTDLAKLLPWIQQNISDE